MRANKCCDLIVKIRNIRSALLTNSEHLCIFSDGNLYLRLFCLFRKGEYDEKGGYVRREDCG